MGKRTHQKNQRNFQALYELLASDMSSIRELVDDALGVRDSSQVNFTVDRVRELAAELRDYKRRMIDVRLVADRALGERQSGQTVLQRVEALARAHEVVGSALRANVA